MIEGRRFHAGGGDSGSPESWRCSELPRCRLADAVFPADGGDRDRVRLSRSNGSRSSCTGEGEVCWDVSYLRVRPPRN